MALSLALSRHASIQDYSTMEAIEDYSSMQACHRGGVLGCTP